MPRSNCPTVIAPCLLRVRIPISGDQTASAFADKGRIVANVIGTGSISNTCRDKKLAGCS